MVLGLRGYSLARRNYMIYTISFVLLSFAFATVHAVRAQHLVVLRWPVGYFFMERGEDGRYTLFSPIRLPLVIARYSRLALVAGVYSLSRRVRSRVAHTRVAYR
jgi:hypothetical protein